MAATFGLVGCQSEGVGSPDQVQPVALAVDASAASVQDQEPDEKQGEGEAKAEKEASLKEKLADAVEAELQAEQKRSFAETELELAKLDQQVGEIKVVEALRSKQAAWTAAQEQLASFEAREIPLALREKDLSLERSADRLLKAETDLVNMREIMGEEAEAKNKEEIIRRYETAYRFAQESLSIETEKRALEVEVTHRLKLAKLKGAVQEAEAGFQAEKIRADRERSAAELKVRKAKDGFATAERKLEKAGAKVQKLKAEQAAKAVPEMAK